MGEVGEMVEVGEVSGRTGWLDGWDFKGLRLHIFSSRC